MAASVAQPYSEKSDHRSPTPDSIEKELEWLIAKDEKEKVNDYESDADQSDRRLSPLPLDHRDNSLEQKSTSSPSPRHSPHPPSPSVNPPAPEPQNNSQEESSPSRVFPARDSLAIDSTERGGGPDDDDYLSYSDSQRKANEELTSMKLDLGYTDEEPPPEYDVAERVRKLNEELANEPPPDDGKERSIKFKENLVDLVAPPPPDDSEDDTIPSQDGQAKSPREQLSTEDSGTPRSEQDTDGETDRSQVSNTSEDAEDQPELESGGNKVIVERNGKFDYVNVDDLTAEERELYSIPDFDKESEETREHKPKPPNGPRPSTSGGESMSRGQGHNSRRVQSAKPRPQSHSEWNEEFTYQSPYAMTPEQRRELAEKQREEQKRKKEEEKSKERAQREKSQENEEAFKAWLRKKQEQNSQRRRSGSQQKSDDKSSNDSKTDREKAYKEWLKIKKEQAKKEKELQKREQKEYDEGWYVRPREECDRAYREWLKRKNAEIKRQREEDKQRARIHRLWLRRSRKSQQLAKAIKQAQAFRYVDYYGYRF